MPHHPSLKQKNLSAPAILAGTMVLGIGLFVFGNIKDLIFGSPLRVEIVPDGTTLSEGFLPITGVAEHARTVSVNGRTLFIDREGNFSDGIILSPGYNVVEVALQNQFGKQTVRTYHLVFDGSSAVASASQAPETY